MKYLLLLMLMCPALFLSGQKLSPTRLKYIGSSTVGNFIQDADKMLPEYAFDMDTRPESSGGERAILEGRTDLAGIARLPGKELLSSGVKTTLIGWDAIAIIVNKANGVTRLSKEQLKKIYLGEIKNWSALGGEDLAIHPYIVGPESATRKVCRSVILGEADYKAYEEVSPDADIVRRVQNDAGGIGQISFSFVKDNEEVTILKIEGQALTLANKQYPITRPLYLLWWPGRADVGSFVRWATSEAGQKLARKRFIPVREAAIKYEADAGELIVYTRTSPVEDGGIYFYPHEPYEIYTADHHLVMKVPNHLSPNDESPNRIKLPEGDYIIRVAYDGQKPGEFSVTISAGKLVKLYPEREKARLKYEKTEHKDNAMEQEIRESNTRRFEFYGDYRIRAEEDVRTDYDRFRGRFRIRAGMHASLNEQIKVGVRLVSTGNPDDPNSSHVNLTRGFNQIRVAFDRAFVYYHPRESSNFEFWVGKFSNPNVSSQIYSEIVWDADIQPEGIAVSYQLRPRGHRPGLRFVNGLYELSQFKTGTRKNWLFTSQLTGSLDIGTKWSVTASSGLYYYKNIKDLDVQAAFIDGNDGNLQYEKSVVLQNDTVKRFFYVSDFYLGHAFLHFKTTVRELPVIFKLQGLSNFGAQSERLGYTAGMSLGQLKEAGDWYAYYQYNYLQRESVFTPFAQDDALIRSHTKGHIAGLAYNLKKKLSIHLWALMNRSLNGGSYQSRFRIDLNAKF